MARFGIIIRKRGCQRLKALRSLLKFGRCEQIRKDVTAIYRDTTFAHINLRRHYFHFFFSAGSTGNSRFRIAGFRERINPLLPNGQGRNHSSLALTTSTAAAAIVAAQTASAPPPPASETGWPAKSGLPRSLAARSVRPAAFRA